MTTALKTGDRVRCTDASGLMAVKEGDTLEVMATRDFHQDRPEVRVVKLHNGRPTGPWYWFFARRFALDTPPDPLAVFKPGDRVRCVKPRGIYNLEVGDVFTVTGIRTQSRRGKELRLSGRSSVRWLLAWRFELEPAEVSTLDTKAVAAEIVQHVESALEDIRRAKAHVLDNDMPASKATPRFPVDTSAFPKEPVLPSPGARGTGLVPRIEIEGVNFRADLNALIDAYIEGEEDMRSIICELQNAINDARHDLEATP